LRAAEDFDADGSRRRRADADVRGGDEQIQVEGGCTRPLLDAARGWHA
jgi:hypothetical protein